MSETEEAEESPRCCYTMPAGAEMALLKLHRDASCAKIEPLNNPAVVQGGVVMFGPRSVWANCHDGGRSSVNGMLPTVGSCSMLNRVVGGGGRGQAWHRDAEKKAW